LVAKTYSALKKRRPWVQTWAYFFSKSKKAKKPGSQVALAGLGATSLAAFPVLILFTANYSFKEFAPRKYI
jgi:hypothetical protein